MTPGLTPVRQLQARVFWFVCTREKLLQRPLQGVNRLRIPQDMPGWKRFPCPKINTFSKRAQQVSGCTRHGTTNVAQKRLRAQHTSFNMHSPLVHRCALQWLHSSSSPMQHPILEVNKWIVAIL